MLCRWLNIIKENFLSNPLTLENDEIFKNIDASSMPDDVYLLYQSAKNGNEIDIFKLGAKYYHGQGVDRDCAFAYEVFSLLQDVDADAEYYMGEICRLGLHHDEPDYKQACIHYAMSGNLGHNQGFRKLSIVAEESKDEFWLAFLKRNE